MKTGSTILVVRNLSQVDIEISTTKHHYSSEKKSSKAKQAAAPLDKFPSV